MNQTVRVATYNLDGFGEQDLEPGDARLRALREVLVSLDADVLCLQEVNAQNAGTRHHTKRRLSALEALLHSTPYRDFHSMHSLHRDRHGPLDIRNLVILSRYPMREQRQIWHDLVPVSSFRLPNAQADGAQVLERQWERPLLYTQLDIEGVTTLHLFNAHLRAPLAAYIEGQKLNARAWRTTSGWAQGFYLAVQQRNGQALEVRLAVDELLDTDADARVIVCGDLNADLLEMPVRIICAAADDTGNPALAKRALHPLESIAPPADRFSVIHAGHRYMLDHILVSDPLVLACRQVSILNQDSPAADWPSDHAPLVAEFEISIEI